MDEKLEGVVCHTKHDNLRLYLIGKPLKDEWRKFAITNSVVNENGVTDYISCLYCQKLAPESEILVQSEKPKIAHVIVRNGQIDESRPIVHNPLCKGEKYSVVQAEQLDRNQRRQIASSPADIKSLWREV